MAVEEVTQRIGQIGVIPVVRAHSIRVARLAVEAICAGGIPIVEITMTVPGAPEVIRQVVSGFGKDILTGAGTVTTAEQAHACIDAGAQFLVSPGFSASVLRVAASRRVLAIPGILTPSEVMAAQEAGINLVKVFPCGSAGGPRHLKALRGPFPGLQMIPTGGVTLTNVGEYIAAGAFAVGVGSELVNEAALNQHKGVVVTEAARHFVEAVRQARREKPIT
ncbi:MAG: bifunctional 4-hydroxy-2-oxoglutarate aldolase/2-dehydro-3-deoxy-phosphogluconate aldolase [Candidatus Acidiferrum sp.]